MASFNVYVVFGVVTIMASGVVMARDVDTIKANNCETKMTLHCVIEVFTSIFKTGIVTDNCCIELIGLGQFCHDALIKKTLQNPLFKNNDTSVILSRGAQVWNKCNLVNKNVSPSSSPY
ncbi:Prolamin-like domain - like 10 [Theobroma cacao]|nr:Prolamin-like domain - like 10 [Theobroma cacao]